MNAFVEQLFDISLQAGFVIAVILVVRLLFFLCKVPKRYAYLLWIIPFLRLVCPWTPESEWSILPKQLNAGVLLSVSSETQRVKDGLYGVDDNYTDAESAAQGKVAEPESADEKEGESSHNVYSGKDNASGMLSFNEHRFLKGDLFGVIWLAGVVLLLVYSVLSYVHLRKRLIGKVHLKDNIYLADYIDTPFVLGLARPIIFLPSDIEERDMHYVIAHEQVHIRRKDYLIKMVTFMIVCVYWFQPLVWIAFFCMGNDMEMSCDERVIEEIGEEHKGAYATSLLELTGGCRRISGVPLAFGEGSPKGRIRNIMKYKRSATIIGVIAVLVMIGLAAVLLTTPKNDTASELGSPVNEIHTDEEKQWTSDSETVDVKDLKNIEAGVYVMETAEGMESMYAATLSIYGENEFSLSCNPLSSYLPHGRYRIEDGILIASDENRDYKFRINEDGSLTYCYEQPVVPSSVEGKSEVAIAAGARFYRVSDSDTVEKHDLNDIFEPAGIQ